VRFFFPVGSFAMLTEAFKLAVLKYRARGGKVYQLAIEFGMTPSALSAFMSGARRVVTDEERLIRIGVHLGLKPDEVFEDDAEQVAS
jgi:hypothetical protein